MLQYSRAEPLNCSFVFASTSTLDEYVFIVMFFVFFGLNVQDNSKRFELFSRNI